MIDDQSVLAVIVTKEIVSRLLGLVLIVRSTTTAAADQDARDQEQEGEQAIELDLVVSDG